MPITVEETNEVIRALNWLVRTNGHPHEDEIMERQKIVFQAIKTLEDINSFIALCKGKNGTGTMMQIYQLEDVISKAATQAPQQPATEPSEARARALEALQELKGLDKYLKEYKNRDKTPHFVEFIIHKIDPHLKVIEFALKRPEKCPSWTCKMMNKCDVCGRCATPPESCEAVMVEELVEAIWSVLRFCDAKDWMNERKPIAERIVKELSNRGLKITKEKE